jgi:hypothetical protein
MKHKCNYCEVLLNNDSMARHLNAKHRGDVTPTVAATYSLVIHPRCGGVYTQQGLKRHCNNCNLNAAAADAFMDNEEQVGAIPMAEDTPIEAASQNRENPAPEAVIAAIPVVEAAQEELPGDGVPNNIGQHGEESIAREGQPTLASLDLTTYSGNHDLLRLFVSLHLYPAPSLLNVHAAVKKEFAKAVNIASTNYLRDQSEEMMLRLLLLPKMGIQRTIAASRKAMGAINAGQYRQLFESRPPPITSTHHGHNQPPAVLHPTPDDNNDDPTPDDNNDEELPRVILTPKEITKIKHLFNLGKIRSAGNIVRGTGKVVNITSDVIKDIQQKHPRGTLNPFGDAPGPEPEIFRMEAASETLDNIVNQLDIQSSPGISGWSGELIKLCYREQADNRNFKNMMMRLTLDIYKGKAAGQSMLCASRMTPIQQLDKLRPIAVGEMFYRITIRVILKTVSYENALLSNQLGVGSPGGVEPMVEMVLKEYENQLENNNVEERYIENLDISNAYNNCSRKHGATAIRDNAPNLYRAMKWIYNSASPLVMGANGDIYSIKSDEGFRQGCPAASIGFSIAIKAKLKLIPTLATTPLSTNTAGYMDDIAVVTSDPTIMDAVKELFAPSVEGERPVDGLILNPRKCKHTPVSTLLDNDNGLQCMGTCIGNATARSAFLKSKIDLLRPVLHRLRQLPHQIALTLLRLCFAPQLRHLLRTLETVDLVDQLQELDELLFKALDHLRGQDHSEQGRPTKVESIYKLPLSSGGLGIFSHVDIREPANKASRTHSKKYLRDHMGIVLPPEPPPDPLPLPRPDMNVDPSQRLPKQKELCAAVFDKTISTLMTTLTNQEVEAFHDNGSKIGTAFLHAMPRGAYRTLSDRQLSSALNYRCLAPNPAEGRNCSRCGESNTPTHPEHCRGGMVPTVYRHHAIKLATEAAIRASGRLTTNEPAAAIQLPPALPPGGPGQQPPPVIHNINAQRYDTRVGNADGGAALDPVYGLVDYKVKAVHCTDTINARARARADLQPQPDSPHPVSRRSAWAAIGASLEFCAHESRTHYAHIPTPQPVVPLVISSGGTLHKDFHKFLKVVVAKHLLPNLYIDFSLALVRARAEAYPRA